MPTEEIKSQHYNSSYKLFKKLKIKKKIGKNPVKKNQEDDITKIQNELKNSIKNLYLSNQKKKKTIDEYARLFTKIREEYAKLQQENNQLKIELQKYKNYVEQLPQTPFKKYYSKPMRKRKHYLDLQQKQKVTKVTRMLQKYVDVQNNKKEEE